MKRSFLEDLGIPKESINEIMKMHGQSRNEAAGQSSAIELQEETEALRQQATELKDKIEQLESIDIDVETTKLEQEIEGYKNNMLKMKIASEYNIPFDLTDKLSGVNEDELRADAEQLASYVKPPQIILPLKSTEVEKAPENPYRTMVNNIMN
ncbi:MAG: hypothetical protein PWR19_2162 [Carnobacterium sp.]|uniref:phage scaffolding protein n=1 Tax=Carnobacterium sp. TaxID=48221 RepID=UPI002648A0B3|nr:hypothetical protein [Carnobacterium sp.]MDN5373116.1 hypothetical protein [Carnobacterium sp.]